jgi:hypothetical protein
MRCQPTVGCQAERMENLHRNNSSLNWVRQTCSCTTQRIPGQCVCLHGMHTSSTLCTVELHSIGMVVLRINPLHNQYEADMLNCSTHPVGLCGAVAASGRDTHCSAISCQRYIPIYYYSVCQ